ncbi:MAG: ImmA/IrrE family metallo-endopeptidase [Acidimicrobiales bacterium]
MKIVAADELVDRSRLEELEELQADAFSAATFRVPAAGHIIVYNPLSSFGRRRSDQAHELAHILLDHDVRTVERIGSMQFLTCDVEQEDEANWLGGCLLLPRPLLLKAAKQNLSPSEIAERFEVSEKMARFRLNASGVLVQVGRERALRRRNVAE